MKVSASPAHADFDELLDTSLRPAELAEKTHRVLAHQWATTGTRSSLHLHALMATADGHPTAATYRRSATSEGVVLPPHAPDPERWLGVCLRRWARQFGQFPIVGAWADVPRWQTVGQEVAAAEKAEVEQELRRTTERLKRRIEELRELAEEERSRAILGARRLIDEKGPPLADAVIEALSTLGFEVTDLDKEPEPADGAGRSEDIGLTDPDAPSLDPVVEIKGYDKGAKATDLLKLGRHRNRALAAGRTPTATWWIINHNRSTAPDERGPVLKGEDATIAEGARPDNLGLVVIDTRDLFLATKAVEAGTVEAGEVRASLRAASGRWGGLPED